jgi:hypothetical protein
VFDPHPCGKDTAGGGVGMNMAAERERGSGESEDESECGHMDQQVGYKHVDRRKHSKTDGRKVTLSRRDMKTDKKGEGKRQKI